MNANTARIIAMSLGVVAVLFFIAGPLGILAGNVGTFLGIAASLGAGLFWALTGRTGE